VCVGGFGCVVGGGWGGGGGGIKWRGLVMTREGGSEGGEGEQVQVQLVRPPTHHWYILQSN